MHQSDLLSVATRRLIFEAVGEHPGAHLRDIGRRCGMALGTTLYHLDRLEQGGLVASRRDGRYKRYFAGHELGRREKDVLSILRHDAPRRIVAALLGRAPQTQRELCDAIGISRSTLSFHVNRLVADGLVARTDARPENFYGLAEEALAREMLEKYALSLRATTPAPEPLRVATGGPAAAVG